MKLDEWTGFQLDSALALRFDLEEKEFTLSIVDALLEGLANVSRSMGAKVRRGVRQKLIDNMYDERQKQIASGDLPTLDEALLVFGARAGTIIERRKKT